MKIPKIQNYLHVPILERNPFAEKVNNWKTEYKYITTINDYYNYNSHLTILNSQLIYNNLATQLISNTTRSLTKVCKW